MLKSPSKTREDCLEGGSSSMVDSREAKTEAATEGGR